MSIIHHIIFSGISDSDAESSHKRSIILVNGISLVLIAALALLLAYRVVIVHNVFWHVLIHTFAKGFVIFSIPIILNRFHLYTLGKFTVCVIPLVFIWQVFIEGMREMQSIETSQYDGLRIYLLMLSPFPYLLFRKNNLLNLCLTILPLLCSLLFFEQILGLACVNHIQKGMGGEDYPLMYIRTLVAYFGISGVCLVFQEIVARYEESNHKMLIEIKSQKEEIVAQNEALVQSQDQLNHIFQNLETLVNQKTEAIQRQNEKIVKFTFANSHMVRASVARISGLMNLSNLDHDLNRPIYFKKIEEEIIVLDEITRTITKDLNTAIE